MLKQIFLITLILLSLNAISQTKSTNEVIAEGGSKIKVRPDLVTFTLTVEKRDAIEKNAIKLLNIEIDQLVKSLNQIGFNNKAVKIASYEISSSEDDKDKKKYSATNVLKLEFGIDTKLIDALYKNVQESELTDLDISYETKISDSLEKATRLKLVQNAIEDAKSNANNIASTLKIKLIGVKQVQKYSQGLFERDKVEIVKFTPPKVVGDTEIKYKTPFDKFQVEDVELEEKITIVYEISN